MEAVAANNAPLSTDNAINLVIPTWYLPDYFDGKYWIYPEAYFEGVHVPTRVHITKWDGDVSTTYLFRGYAFSKGSFPTDFIAKTPDIAERIQLSSRTNGGIYRTDYSFQTYVMPSGMSGSWSDGGVDSFLMVPWAYSAFHDGDFTAANEMVTNFADAFYRHDAASIFGNYSRAPYSCADN